LAGKGLATLSLMDVRKAAARAYEVRDVKAK
jgi:hypothetical protein